MGTLSRSMQLANSLWGGRYSPIFPFIEEFDTKFRVIFGAEESVENFYLNVLKNYDPDIIIIDDVLNQENISRIADGRIMISLNEFESQIINLENSYGLTILEIGNELINEMFEFKRNDELKIELTKNEKADPLISTLFNTPIKSLHERLVSILQNKEFFEESTFDITDLYAVRTKKSINYTILNTYQLKTIRAFCDYYEYIFIFDREDLYSLFVLWNLKAAGRRVFAFPITNYINGELDNALLEFYGNSNSESFGPSIFYNPYLSAAQINRAFDYISQVVKKKNQNIQIVRQRWIPRFGSDGEIAQHDGVISNDHILKSQYNQVKNEDGYLRYNLLSTGFKITEHTYRKTHKVTSYIHYLDHLLNHPSVIEGITNLDWVRMTQSMFTDDCRISKSGIIRFCEGYRNDMHFIIPETSDYLKKFFSNRGFVFSVPAQGELTRQIFKNIGGIYGITRFSSDGAIKVLEEFEDSTVLNLEYLISLIQKHKPFNFEKRPFDFIQILLENNIIELGANIQCTVCYQRSFYSIKEFSTQNVCKSCRNSFNVPQYNPKETFKWSYLGIGPFSKNNKIDGLFSCFLTLHLFEDNFSSTEGITSFMNFQLEKMHRHVEVDLMLQLSERRRSEKKTELVYCECKTYKNFNQTDIDRMIFLGEQFPGSILVMSTLNKALTDDEVRLVSSLVNYFRKGHGNRPLNSVLILTANELLPKKYNDPFDHFGEIHNSIKYNDYLGFLCEKSCELYLKLRTWNDLKMEEWKEEQNKKKLIGSILHSLVYKKKVLIGEIINSLINQEKYQKSE